MSGPLTAIRADSSVAIGSGHLMRCLTLAAEIRRRGGQVEFICRDHAGSWIGHLISSGFAVHRLPAPKPRDRTDPGPYGSWLGVSQEQDAEESRAALAGRRVNWLVVDHYALDHTWESALRPAATRILSIDDIANRPHDCDVLLDQNYCGSHTAARYDGLVPASTRCLLGPGYALLRPEYRQVRELMPPRDGRVGRVTVFFGGSDPSDCTSKVVEALSCPELGHLAVDVVIGANHGDPARVRALAAARPGTTVHVPLPTMAGILARGDVAIGAGGSTTWERACLGVPAIVATIAENQKPFTTALANDGYQISLGDAASTTVAEWRERMIALATTPARVAGLAARSAALVDGWGAGRVYRHMSGADDSEDLIVADDHPARIVDAAGMTIARLTVGDGTDERTIAVAPDPLLAGAISSNALVRAAVQHGRDAGPFLRLAADDSNQSSGPLRITLLSDAASWMNADVADFAVELLHAGHRVRWVHRASNLIAGDVCVILSFGAILAPEALALHRHNLVVHESALPHGKGWSPLTWQILEGKRRIPVTLFEAVPGVDAGPIYLQDEIALTGTELVDEWRRMQADISVALVREWLGRFPEIVASRRPQTGTESHYARRRPEHSRLDPAQPLAEQFDLLRVVDNVRYPAWFEIKGRRFRLAIDRFE